MVLVESSVFRLSGAQAMCPIFTLHYRINEGSSVYRTFETVFTFAVSGGDSTLAKLDT